MKRNANADKTTGTSRVSYTIFRIKFYLLRLLFPCFSSLIQQDLPLLKFFKQISSMTCYLFRTQTLTDSRPQLSHMHNYIIEEKK